MGERSIEKVIKIKLCGLLNCNLAEMIFKTRYTFVLAVIAVLSYVTVLAECGDQKCKKKLFSNEEICSCSGGTSSIPIGEYIVKVMVVLLAIKIIIVAIRRIKQGFKK